MFDIILIILLVLALILNITNFILKRKIRDVYHHIHIKFVGGNKTKLILNDEQYEQLQAFLNQADGHFEIGDDQDNVKIYREHICSVEVKKK